MSKPASFKLHQGEHGATVVLTGDWTAETMDDADDRLAGILDGAKALTADLRSMGRCDTAGAYAILRAAEGQATAGEVIARPETRRLLDLVAAAIEAEPSPSTQQRGVYDLLVRVGKGVFHIFQEVVETFAFIGRLTMSLLRGVARPSRVRWAPIFAQCERAGLDALPIVATGTAFIGAVVALIGINTLRDFGATVFVVETIGIAVLREFGIVITAVLIAGRSASAFAAEIGAMKMRQEIDAMQVMGVDPFDALVLPRFVALLLMMPLLTFVADLSGLAGGMIVTWNILDLSPTFFLQRIVDNVGATHFWVGISKAPIMAAVIAGIGSRQGMEVGGDVISLGQRVTSAVVQAIFTIIVIDAVFAVLYMKLDV
ncbi:MAG: MlaE family lipid ABC transporter permease subunit [Caulobacter sp.]|nr:MlaE family lipid ABC transporter permease subunit [Caulobacter sp.]